MPCRPAISSMSLGRCYAGHDLNHKLAMAAKHGLQGIELFWEDLVDLARPQTNANILAAAAHVRQLCASHGLEILCLQPFWHYEGLLDRTRHAERITELRLWIQVAKALDTDMIQVPSSFLPKDQISPDISLIVSDLQELADIGLQQTPPIRFAYESLCWATYIDTWEQSWTIVQQVDRPNFGLCLDTFNILGRIYADPTSPSGCNPSAPESVSASITRLIQLLTPNKHKIFFLQIVDAERLHEPLRPGHPFYNPTQPTRMSWSRNCRLFYGEHDRGAYLPVQRVAAAILKDIGWEGWVSAELFNRVMERKDDGVVEELASRAGASWRALVADLELEGEGRGWEGAGRSKLVGSEGVEVAHL